MSQRSYFLQTIVGIEVKASTTLNKHDLYGLQSLREQAGDKFVKGIVLYTGDQSIALGNDLYTLPVQALWKL